MPYVNGIYFGAPGTAVVVNDTNFQGAPNVGGLGVLLIGPSVDGQPNVVLGPFASPNAAIAQLKGGDGLQGVLNTFTGAAKVPGGFASISLINVNPLTVGASVIKSAGAVAQINLQTVQYGLPANSDKWMVQAGSTNGYKISQASDYVGPGGLTFAPDTTDNVGLNVVSIYYNGTGTTPTYTVSDTQLVLTATTSDTGGTITFTTGMTAQQLVNQINTFAGWNAAVLDPNPNDLVFPADVVPGTTTKSIQCLFDNVPTAAAVSTVSTAPTILTANIAEVVRYFNALNLYFTATRQAGATSLATSSAWTYATGGTQPTATNSDWQNAYTTAQSAIGMMFAQAVSSALSIAQMNDAHCQYMASIGQPRRGYWGDVSGQTLATEITNQQTLNSNRTSLVWPEQQGVDYNGNPTTFPPYLEACSVLGQRAATPPTQALTQQPVASNGMSIGVAVTPGMVAQALQNNIAILAPNQHGIIVMQHDMTTWSQNSAYDKVENATGLMVDIITMDLNAALQQFIGKITPLGIAQSKLFSRLNYWYGQGYIVVQPKLTDVQLTQPAADQIGGAVNAAIGVPTNYIGLQLVPVAVAS